MISYIDIRNRR